jgi:hypothetical protein
MTPMAKSSESLAIQKPEKWIGALPILRSIFPPDTVIHAGVGRGLGEIHAWREWAVENAWLIDANGERLDWARHLESNGRWRAIEAVVADTAGLVEFHHTSNPVEDGLIPTEELRVYWANLRAVATRQVRAKTIDELVSREELHGNVWLLIDCSAANRILQGARRTLESAHVVFVRTLESEGESAADPTLSPQGFKLVARLESNHPAVNHLVFVRDTAAQCVNQQRQLGDERSKRAQLEHSINLLEREKAELSTELADQASKIRARDEAVAQRDALAAELEQLQTKVKALTAENDSQAAAMRNELQASRQAEAKVRADSLAENQKLTVALEKLEFANQKLQKEITQLVSAREVESKAHAAAVTKLDFEIKIRNDLQAQKDAESKAKADLVKQLEQLQDEATGLKQRVEDLNATNSQLQSRTSLLAEELVKAEGQIELIKDLLLRDGGL